MPQTDAGAAMGRTGSWTGPKQLLSFPLGPHWHMTPQLIASVAQTPRELQHSDESSNTRKQHNTTIHSQSES